MERCPGRGWDGSGGMMGGNGMNGGGDNGGKNQGQGNRTEMLIQVCTENNIVCSEVDEDFLANNCTRPERPNWDRNLLETSVREVQGDTKTSELGFADAVPGERRLQGGDGGGGRPGAGMGGGGGGNLTDTEIEAMKLKRLTCKCCKDREDNSD